MAGPTTCASGFPSAAIALAARVKLAGKEFVGDQRELYLSEEPLAQESPYERLLGDAMNGDGALFTREDAVEAAWAVVDPVFENPPSVHPYKRGSWGPKDADAIIASDGCWHNPRPKGHQEGERAATVFMGALIAVGQSGHTVAATFCPREKNESNPKTHEMARASGSTTSLGAFWPVGRSTVTSKSFRSRGSPRTHDLRSCHQNSHDYDDAIRQKLKEGKSGEALFFDLAIEDLRQAADLFAIHDLTNGVDGWVSLEVSPLLAHDMSGTLAAAKALHARAERPNLFIKIPAPRRASRPSRRRS